MGEVFAAHDLEDKVDVAVKVVGRQGHGDVLMSRLHREAEASLRIRSDYVPRVIDVSATETGEVFMVMERLVGTTLAGYMSRHGQLEWEDAAPIAEDVLRGLIDAHTAGVVHRDLKPSNVFLVEGTNRRRAMVLDFGICKLESPDTDRLTATNEAIGTVAYMAPEQIRGASAVDDRADLFAFGVLIYEMLTGKLPHEGPTQMAILASKLEDPPIPFPEEMHARVPEGVEAIVMKALQRDPASRYASAQDLLKAWRTVYRHADASRPPPSVFVESVAPPSVRPSGTAVFVEAEPTIFDSALPEIIGASAGRSRSNMVSWQAVTFGGSAGLPTRRTKLAVTMVAVGLAAGLLAITVVAVRRPEPKVIVTTTSGTADLDPAPSVPADPVELLPAVDAGEILELLDDDPPALPEGRPGAKARPTSAKPAPVKGRGNVTRLTAEPRY